MSLIFRTVVLLALMPAAVCAGGQATIEAGGQGGSQQMELAWQDADTLRMESGQPGNYFITRDGKAYSVSMQGGKPVVMDMAAMMDAMRGMAGKNAAETPAGSPGFARPGSFESTGETEVVAGVKGEVYRMEWTDPDGKQHVDEAVLTDDPTVVEMTRAYMNSLKSMFSARQMAEFQADMPDGNKGLLRVGSQFRVTSVSDATPPDSTFELPAKPMDMQQLMRGGGY